MNHLSIPEGLSVRRFASVPYVRYWYEANENADLMTDLAELRDKGIQYRVYEGPSGAVRLYVPTQNVGLDGDWVAVKH